MSIDEIKIAVLAEFNSRDKVSREAMFHDLLRCISETTLYGFAMHIGLNTVDATLVPGLTEAIAVENKLSAIRS